MRRARRLAESYLEISNTEQAKDELLAANSFRQTPLAATDKLPRRDRRDVRRDFSNCRRFVSRICRSGVID